MQIEFVDATDTAVHATLRAQIDAFNDRFTGMDEPERKLAVLLCDPATGAVEGGLLGVSYYRWLFVDILVLPKEKRGAGLGSRILCTAEREAARRGCIGVWLVSASFQAPGFYLKRGFREFGMLAFPPGHRTSLLQKSENLGQCDPGEGLEVTETPTERDEAALNRAIDDYNRPFAGPPDPRQFGLVVRDGSGAVAGGLWAKPQWGWLFIETLILPEDVRHRGLGTRLMRMAEQEARDRGYAGVFLDTFTFQARPFYEKLGYTVFAEISEYPPGHSRFVLSRRLDEAAGERR